MTHLVTLGETALRLSPPGSEPLADADDLSVSTTGPESNAGVVARRLGADVTWVSRLPDTPLGRRAAADLRSYDLDLAVEWADAGRQGLTFYGQAGRPRTPERVEDRGDAAVAGLGMDDLPLDLVRGADGVYVTGATPGLSTDLAGATARLLKTAADASALAAFGLVYRPALWNSPEAAGETFREFFPAVDVFVAHEDDVAAVLGRDGQPATVAHGLAAEWDLDVVALARDRTAVALAGSTVHEYPVAETDAVDETGAFDAFAGAFVASLLADAAVPDALKRAVAARALARTLPGSVPAVTRAEVDRVAAAVDRDRG